MIRNFVSYILFSYLYSYASFLDIFSTFKAWNILLSRNLNIEHISSKRQSNQRNLSAYLTFTSSSQYWIRDNKLHRFEKDSFIMRSFLTFCIENNTIIQFNRKPNLMPVNDRLQNYWPINSWIGNLKIDCK